MLGFLQQIGFCASLAYVTLAMCHFPSFQFIASSIFCHSRFLLDLLYSQKGQARALFSTILAFLQHRRKLEEEKGGGGGGALHRLSNFSLSPFPFLHPLFSTLQLLLPLSPFIRNFTQGFLFSNENPTHSPPFFGVTNKKKEREIWEKRCRLRLKRGKERRHSQERKRKGKEYKGERRNFLTFSLLLLSLSRLRGIGFTNSAKIVLQSTRDSS